LRRSIEADARKDLQARLALFTPDYTVELLNGETLDAKQLAQGIAGFHRSTIAFSPETRVVIERLERNGKQVTVWTNQHLVRTVRGPDGRPVERVSNIRHREEWIETAEGWKVRHVEEIEQGPVTLDGKAVEMDTQGTAFVRVLNREGAARARVLFDAARAKDPNAVLFQESTLNSAGYSLLARGRTADALEAFRLNAEAYPSSANVWDSLGETYLALKDTAKATEYYRKVIDLTPTDDRVLNILERAGAPVAEEELAALLRKATPQDLELIPNVVFGEGSGRPLLLHLLRARPSTATPQPLLLFVHGGGWTDGTKERGLVALQRFVRRGFTGASVGYRRSAEATFPAQIDDVKSAIRFLRANAATYGIDPHRIAVWGQSAGGHLAALAGTNSDDRAARPDLVIDWNGPTDLLEPRELERQLREKAEQRWPTIAIERLLGGPIDEHRDAAEAANPIRWVSPDDPPFLILHGTGDTTVDISQSRALYDALQAAGVDATLRVFEGDAHFGVHPILGIQEPYAREMEAFLDRHF
jgi:acetyl esterase/lipase